MDGLQKILKNNILFELEFESNVVNQQLVINHKYSWVINNTEFYDTLPEEAHKRIQNFLSCSSQALHDILDEHISVLEEDYEDLTSDQSIVDTMREGNYRFLESGILIGSLEDILNH